MEKPEIRQKFHTSERVKAILIPIRYNLTGIIHLKSGQKRVTCFCSPLHCHSRFLLVQAICSHHHSQTDIPGVLSIFRWGATPLLKTTSQPRALLTHVMQSCSAGAWQCSCLPPKPPKTSLSLSPSLWVLASLCHPLELFWSLSTLPSVLLLISPLSQETI